MQNELIRPVGPTPSPAPARRAPAREPESWPLPGLCWNSRVATSFGDLPVQGLRVRDLVRTSSGQFLPVRWVDQIHLDEDFVAGCPDARPVVIAPGTFGAGHPSQVLTLSPQQRLNTAPGNYGQNVRPARDLLGNPNVRRSTESAFTYYLFHVGEPALVQVEGVWISTTP
jgi:hypothetical protein